MFSFRYQPVIGLTVSMALLPFSLPLSAWAQNATPSPLLVSERSAVANRAYASFDSVETALLTDAKANSEILANLEFLSDNIGPRLTGSEKLKKANEWTAGKMKEYGLQNVHLEPYTIPIGWERGAISFKLLSPDEGFTLTAAQMAWTPGTRGKVRGDVVLLKVATEEDLAAYKGKLKDAIVMQGAPSEVGRVGDSIDKADPNPNAPKSYTSLGVLPRPTAGPRDYKPGQPATYASFRALRQKISAFLKEEGAAAILMDSSKPHGLLNMTGSWSSMGAFKDGKPEKTPLPTFFVVHDHYAMLYRLAQTALNQNKPSPKVELEAKSKFVKGPVTVYNTVGEIRGSEKPDEFVVLGAHLDSWDLAQGTTDNGTGTCVVLESARILAKSAEKPRRSIRFILFSGEEQGLFGSKAYAEAHAAELPKMQAALVHDTGTGRVTSLGLERRSELRPIMEEITAPLKDLGFTGIGDAGIGPGTDHWSFHEKGVPGFAFLQDGAEYRFTHHSQSDTLDKARPDDLIQGAQCMSVLALRLAGLPDRLPQGSPKPMAAANSTRMTGTDERNHDHDHGDE